MTHRNFLLAVALGASGLALVVDPTTARAQSSTSGAIQGVVVDAKTGEPLPGVTVTATSTASNGAQSAITDEKGFYRITELPPGDYRVDFFYVDARIVQDGVHVGVNKTSSVYQKIDQDKAASGGETIHVRATAPLIDPTSTRQGITIDKEYLNNVPVPGRTFDAALGAAAGSQADPSGLGVSFSGSSALENQYVVDGVNTTGLTYGTVGSPIINDFIEEIEIITGGYNAELGRATGGVVNVVTKSGSNEFKGSIFTNVRSGYLTAAAKRSPVNATSIDLTGNLAYDADFGFEIGGPIVKDKLWFYLGVAPAFSSVDVTRTVKRQTDCRVAADPANGIPEGDVPGLSRCDARMYGNKATPDIDPKTGFFITDKVDEEVRSTSTSRYNLLGKINYAATPEHQGQLTIQALPGSARNPGLLGPAISGVNTKYLTTDVSGKWTSKFNDNKTEVEAIIGWHRDYYQQDALDSSLSDTPAQVLYNGDLFNYAGGMAGGAANGFGETPAVVSGCASGPNSPYPHLSILCPMDTRPYIIGGPGAVFRDTEQRKSARLSLTQRVKLAGTHEIKIGLDGEDNTLDNARLYSGGAFVNNFVGPGQVNVFRWVKLGGRTFNSGGGDNPDPMTYNQQCNTPNPFPGDSAGNTLHFYCAYLSGVPGSLGTQIFGETLNVAGYLRDSWQIQPNLTLNAGIRYEQQWLRYAKFLQNTLDPLTQDQLGTNAMVLNNNWAPRIGMLYDPTKEGRSKIYVHWGRFYESIPMDINKRSFGGEVQYEQDYRASQCDFGTGQTKIDPRIGGPDGAGCINTKNVASLAQKLIGSSGELIAPGIKAEYLDEFIAGAEYEVIDDLKVGVSIQHRAFGRIIEDVSTDGANTYIIANPGEFPIEEENKLVARINATDDFKLKAHLQHELDLFKGIRSFDRGVRDYNALQFTLTRRFSKQLYVQGSYTYSRNIGNYPGSYSPNNGQVDPNISSQFDLIELLANRFGALPLDRPHYIKLDGFYTFDLKSAGELTFGIRARALSGTPTNAYASHWLYGPNESYLLPQGTFGRSDFDHGLDIRVIYGRKIQKGKKKLEAFATIFNIYNRQGTAAVDQTYAEPFKLGIGGKGATLQNANPVSGGTYDDLIWVKTYDRTGNETREPIGRNANFASTVQRYAPADVRLGLRLIF